MPSQARAAERPLDTVVCDVDGTLIDTNYHHTLAWYRAFRRHDITPPAWRIHRAVGMGGDRLVAAVAGDAVETRLGDSVRAAWAEEFAPLLEQVQPLEGARALLERLSGAGLKVVLASSSPPEHLDHYLDLVEGRQLAAAWTTSQDVDTTKPAPDLVEVALDRVQASNAVMVGDSIWDAVAAAKLDVATLALRTGGFSRDELLEAGAEEVYESLPELGEDPRWSGQADEATSHQSYDGGGASPSGPRPVG